MGIHSVTCDSAGAPATYNPAKMSTTNPTVNTFNKSKEDFIWFVKKATTDKKSHGHSELYHSLLKMFVDADTNKDQQEKEAYRQKMFDSMDLKATGVITFDEWLKFCHEHILAKTKTMEAHPMIDSGDAAQYKTFIKAALTKVAGA